MSIVTLNDRAVRSVTAFGSLNTGSMVFIKKLTASSSSTLSFVNGSSDVVLDSTYKEYVFTFNNIHPSNDNVDFYVNASVDGGSNYNATKTTTYFRAGTDEGDTGASVDYRTSEDLAQSTGGQIILQQMGNDNDQCGSGTLHLFNPSSTTFVKHFISRVDGMAHNDQLLSDFIAGYFNTTSAINAIQFSIEAGTIESGDICLYGIL
jgi:hypothetical protein